MPWSYLHVEITQKNIYGRKVYSGAWTRSYVLSAISGPQGIFFATNTQLSF